jgi:hypothetical protein
MTPRETLEYEIAQLKATHNPAVCLLCQPSFSTPAARALAVQQAARLVALEQQLAALTP